MKITQVALSALAVPVFMGTGATALPNFSSLIARAETGPAGAVGNIAGVISKILQIVDGKSWSWDTKTYPQMCEVSWVVKNPSTGCHVTVKCANGDDLSEDFVNCHENMDNSFNDERIGPFHIQFTQYDSRNGIINKPTLSVDYVENGEAWDVTGISDENDKICDVNSDVGLDGKPKKQTYYCGVPLVGKSSEDVNSEGPTNDAGYAPGWCGVHVTQYQKADPATDNYHFDVTVKDNNEDDIGSLKDIDLPTNESKEVSSKLPSTFRITAGDTDKAAVLFKYEDQEFGSNDQEHSCNFGGYQGGKREGDCGFTCN